MLKSICLFFFVLTFLVESTTASESSNYTPVNQHTTYFVAMDDGVELEVIDWGGDDIPLVFLAGLSLNALTFDPIVHSFLDSHRVIGITRVAHGNSDSRKSNYTTERLAKDIINVLNELKFDSAIFAGHSFAGGELSHLGRHYPERVKGLIYIDAVQDLDYMDSHLAVCPDLGYATIDTLHFQDNFYKTQRVKGDDGNYLPFADLSVLGKFLQEEEDRSYAGIVAPAIAINHIPEETEDFFIGLANPNQKCIEEMNKLTYLGIASFIRDKENADVAAIQKSQHMIHMATPEKLVEIMNNWLDRTFPLHRKPKQLR